MSVVATVMRELMSLGVSGDALVAAVDRIATMVETERVRSVEEAVEKASAKADRELAEHKARAVERTRKWRAAREANKPVMSPCVTESHGDVANVTPPREGAQVVIPSLPSLRSEEVAAVVGECAGERVSVDDWPPGKASDHADLLIATVDSPWLDPSKSPDLITTRGRVAAWKRDGASWEFDVLPIVAGLVAKRRQRIGTWKFFDGAISQSIADNRAALQIPDAGTVVQLRATGPPKTIDEKSSASWDYAMKRIAEDG